MHRDCTRGMGMHVQVHTCSVFVSAMARVALFVNTVALHVCK